MFKKISFARTIRIIVATLFIVTASFSNDVQAQHATKKQTVSEKKFSKLMKKKNTVLLDVRTAEEFNSGHIPGAVNIDVQKDDFTQQMQPLDKNKRYLLYCRSGKRSEKALSKMQTNGFENVYHLKGGITEWHGAKE